MAELGPYLNLGYDATHSYLSVNCQFAHEIGGAGVLPDNYVEVGDRIRTVLKTNLTGIRQLLVGVGMDVEGITCSIYFETGCDSYTTVSLVFTIKELLEEAFAVRTDRVWDMVDRL